MIKIKLILLILLALTQISLAQNISCSTNEKSLEKAHQIWEQAIIAKGGRERILNLKTLLTYNRKKTSVGLNVLPDKFWWWSKDREPIGTNVLMYNYLTNIGYRIKSDLYPFSYPLTNEPKELTLSELLPNLLETNWIKPKLLGAEVTKINGQEFDVVCVEISYSANQKPVTDRHDYIFNQQTHLLFQDIRYFDKKIGGGYLTTEYSNYVETKGLKFATKTIGKFKDGKIWNNSEYLVEVDVDYREDLFDKPPSIKDGSDGWKKIIK